MTTISESTKEEYNSDVPILSILNAHKMMFEYSGHGVSYGKKSASLSFNQGELAYKSNFKKIFFKKPTYKTALLNIEKKLKLYNFVSIEYFTKGNKLFFNILSEKELAIKQKQKQISDKLKDFN